MTDQQKKKNEKNRIHNTYLCKYAAFLIAYSNHWPVTFF